MSTPSLYQTLARQHRIKTTFWRMDGRTPHVRKAIHVEPGQQEIYRALGLNSAPGGIRKRVQ